VSYCPIPLYWYLLPIHDRLEKHYNFSCRQADYLEGTMKGSWAIETIMTAPEFVISKDQKLAWFRDQLKAETKKRGERASLLRACIYTLTNS
jgi:hypothetical protein